MPESADTSSFVRDTRWQERSLSSGDCVTDEMDVEPLLQRLSLELFARPFLGRVRFNSRLRTSAGRFLASSQIIEVNPAYVRANGEASLIDTLKHELIHYHYPQGGHGPLFRGEAKRIGCNRFCSPLPGRSPALRYACIDCGQEYLRRRRVNVRLMRCGKCRGILEAREGNARP